MKGTISLLLFLWLLTPFTVVAQQKHLMLPVDFMIENGNFNQTVVKVMKQGSVAFSTVGKTSMKLKLDFNNDYLISFSKPGYITKSICVNTNVLPERQLQAFEPYKIGVKLFKQYEGVNIVVYNQPVARIYFNPNLDDFDYDVDYTKSILSILHDTEEQLEIKAAEERRTMQAGNNIIPFKDDEIEQHRSAEQSGQMKEKEFVHQGANEVVRHLEIPEPISTSSPLSAEMSKEEKKAPLPGMENEAGKPRVNPATAEEQKINSGGTGKDEHNSKLIMQADHEPVTLIATTIDKEKNNPSLIEMHDYEPGNKITDDLGSDVYKHSVKVLGDAKYYRKQVVEKNRTITTITIVKGTFLITEQYTKVEYNWGGLFYFKDNQLAVSENIYQWATGEK